MYYFMPFVFFLTIFIPHALWPMVLFLKCFINTVKLYCMMARRDHGR